MTEPFPIYPQCFAIEDLRTDVFQAIAGKQSTDYPWRFTLDTSAEEDLCKRMMEDGRVIAHHVRNGPKAWLLIVRLSTRPPKLRGWVSHAPAHRDKPTYG